MRRLARKFNLLVTLATAGASAALLLQNPFAAPLAERSIAGARAALERAMAATIDADWLDRRLADAVTSVDADRVEIYLALADQRKIAIDPGLRDKAVALVAAENGVARQAVDCASCAIDIGTCKRLAHVAACAIPVELSPIGDLNALRRAGVDWATGEDVDRIEVGLALAGLGATGLAVGTGGATLPVKAGASLLRAARHGGALTPGFAHVVLGAADVAVSWEEVPAYLRGKVPPEAVADTARLAELGNIAADIERVRQNTSAAETLLLLRHVDTAEDAATLARLAEAQGAGTRSTLEVLGKSRAFRAMFRVSDLALATIAALTALAVQLAFFAGSFLRRMILAPRR